MWRFLKNLLTGALLGLALPVLAQLGDPDTPLFLPLSSEAVSQEMARVLTSKGRPAECLAPVVINRIDGEEVSVSAKGFLIMPGMHRINGMARLDMGNCPFIDDNPVIPSAVDLEVDFEPGGTYFIGYYHAPADTAEWKLVVWHTEGG